MTLSPKDRSAFVEPVFSALLPHLSQDSVLNQALLVRIQDGCSKSTFSSGISLREAAIRASESAPHWDFPPHTRAVVNGAMDELLVFEKDEAVTDVAHI